MLVLDRSAVQSVAQFSPDTNDLTINNVGYRPMCFRVRGSDKTRLLTIKLRRIKFDLGDPPVIRYGKEGPPPLIER